MAGYGAIVLAPREPRLVVCGVIEPPAREAMAARLAHLAEELEEILRRLRPRTVVVEGAFAARNVKSALRIGEARGAVLAAVGRHGIEVIELAPAAAKKAIVGNGNASKEQVAAMVATILKTQLPDVPHDATDALALALAHARRLDLIEATRRSPRFRE